MAEECLWYNGETGHYELLEFEPDKLSEDKIIEKAKAELTKKYAMNEEDFKKAKETLYVIDVDNLRKIGKEDIKSIPERISKLIEGKSEATIKEIFEEARNLEAEKARKQAILDYMDEYRAYVKSCVEDPDFDLTTMEDFDTWVQEEKDEEKIRCRECGSLNTEQRGDIKHCTDCKHEDKITPNNHANWISKKEGNITKDGAMKILEKHLDKDKNTPPIVYRALHSLWEEATPNDKVKEPKFNEEGKCLKCGSKVSFADVTDTLVYVEDEIVKRHDGDITNRNCVKCTYPKQYADYKDYDK